jgi:hypothetical protein
MSFWPPWVESELHEPAHTKSKQHKNIFMTFMKSDSTKFNGRRHGPTEQTARISDQNERPWRDENKMGTTDLAHILHNGAR